MDTDRWDERRQRWEQRQEARRTRWEARLNRHHSGLSGLFIGGIIVAVGLLLLLDNLGIVAIHDVWQYWPVLLIAFGFAHALARRCPAGYAWGGAIALVGALLLLDNLNIIFFNFNLIWPILLIAFGASMLLRGLERRRYLEGGSPPIADPMAEGLAVFGNVKRRVDSEDFRGGEANTVFGEVQFDLRNAKMTVDQAVIDVNVVFGAVKVFVPQTWLVQVKAATVFGGVEDKTLPPRLDPNTKTPRLIITGTVVFGAINLYN